ncbi:DUF4429 domain-containing protein [Streptomyces coffeae]|uniref:DUF4429 domain-containing protein n=1 Tax=Streptomyces coffeae TaxID=621382 RepID=A0ABS1NM32_9ACTN|nr:DUF4429 domain-containing protein [Streptomyces coffeae]MBL1101079.1 DUF4429 domain-containing protein [Streptomyces coffeae]
MATRWEGGGGTRLEFDGRHCVLTYARQGHRSLLHALSGRPVPVQALSGIVLSPPRGHARWGMLRLVPHPGADAVAGVLGNQLPEAADPYVVRFHRSELQQAEQLHRLLERAIAEAGPQHHSGIVMPVPSPPRVLRAVLSQAEFDGRMLRLTGGAHHGSDGAPRVIPIAALDGLTYTHRPFPTLRLHLPGGGAPPPEPFDDPDTLVLNALREGANVLFAARLLEAHRAAEARRSSVRVRIDSAADDHTAFAARAELGAGTAGAVRIRTPSDAPHAREITHLQVERSVAFGDVRVVEDALMHAALRWAYASGATYLTGRVTAGAQRRTLYHRHGFGTREDADRPPASSRPCLVLGAYASRREHDVLGVLDDVAPRQRFAAGCGSWVVAFLLFFAVFLVAGAYRLAAGPQIAGVPLGFLPVAAFITLVAWPRCRAALRAREMKEAKGARAVMMADPRPPVLYLRSFRDDKQARQPSRPGSLVTEEEAVATAMAGIGPFIGLDDEIETLGAAKGRVREKDWRPAVTTLMSSCRLTVMRCGEGESLFWELQQAQRLLRPEQLVILVPGDQDLYEHFRERAALLLPHPLPGLSFRRPAGQRLVAALRFSEDWSPRAVSLQMPRALRFFSLESCLVFRLLPELRDFPYDRLAFWRRRVVFFAITAVALAVLLGRGLPLLEALTTMSTPPDVHVPDFPTFAPPSTGNG